MVWAVNDNHGQNSPPPEDMATIMEKPMEYHNYTEGFARVAVFGNEPYEAKNMNDPCTLVESVSGARLMPPGKATTI